MASPLPDPPFRSHRVQSHIRRTMGSHISGSQKLPRSLHSDPHNSRPLAPRQCRPGRGPPDLRFPLHNVAHLTLGFKPSAGSVSLVAFHGLSPTIRSLRLELACVRLSEVFDLVCSFPLLEDLALFRFSYWNGVDEWTPPSTSPRLTGSLQLHSVGGGTGRITRRLLDLPNGLNFTKIVLCVDDEIDFKSTTDLVSRCSDTLESLDVSDHLRGGCYYYSRRLIDTLPLHSVLSTAGSFNLSAATKLKQLVFQCGRSNVQWTTEALQTAESSNLERITVRPNANTFEFEIAELRCQQWQDLDRLLVQFWASHSIRPKVTYEVGGITYEVGGITYGVGVRKMDIRYYASSLLPELTKRGLVDLVEYGR